MRAFFLSLTLCIAIVAFCASADQGRIIAFAGISGSGKSTLAKELASLCHSKVFQEPEEDEWPEYIRRKQPYSDFSAFVAIRGIRVHDLWHAEKLRKKGELVFIDSCYDKITSYYLGKPGMEWLISPSDPYFACAGMLAKLDTIYLPDPDCIVLIDVSLDAWKQMLEMRGRVRDSIDGFQESYQKYKTYIREAVEAICLERDIQLVVFSQDFGDPKKQALCLFEQLKKKLIL